MFRGLRLAKKLSHSVPSRLPFKSVAPEDIEHFSTFLSPSQILTDPFDIEPFNQSWVKNEKGNSNLVLIPKTTEQVSKILEYCNNKRIAVNPQGGNTGLVGGSVPVYDQLILSLKRMDEIQSFNPVNSVLSCQAGVVLEKANQYLLKYGCEVPLDLGAKGSCQLGGNASTNAGGIHLVKHGSFRSHILGLQAVLPSGEVVDLRSQNHKDNTGFDIKNLLIGSEGTLGIITKLNIHCPQKDPLRRVYLFKCGAYETIIKSLPRIRNHLGKHLCALQYIDGLTFQLSSKNLGLNLMQATDSDHLLLVETNNEDPEGLLGVLPQGFSDSIMSQTDQQFAQIWKVRESASEASVKLGRIMAYDLSYDVGSWPELVRWLREKYPSMTIMGYGHIGDGNIHVNFCSKEEGARDLINDREIYEMICSKRGSISAEHGVGIYKPGYLSIQKSPSFLHLCQQIKAAFDPNGILNPYKVLPHFQ